MPSLTRIRSRPAFARVDASGQGFMVPFDGSGSLMRAQGWIGDVVGYREVQDGRMDVLAAALRRRGLARAGIGLDLDFLPQAAFARLARQLPAAAIPDSYPALAR